MQDIIEEIQPVKMVKLGGAGYKINCISLDVVDCYVRAKAGVSFWDLCGPEAIFRGMGGLCTDFQGNRLVYDEKKQGGTQFPAFFFA